MKLAGLPKKSLRFFPAAAAVLFLLGVGWSAHLYLTLPDVAFLADPGMNHAMTVHDWRGGEHPFMVGPANPDWTPLADVPRVLLDALLAAEDINFYSHRGVDWQGVREAVRRDLREKRLSHGGSTLTQQLAKNLFLSRERTWTRKLREFLLARRMEKALTKDRILELYVNAVEFGPLVYGAGSASRHYFGVPAGALTLRQAALLVAMLPGPRVYDPYRRPERVRKATDRVLDLMSDTRKITEEEYSEAIAAPDGLLSPASGESFDGLPSTGSGQGRTLLVEPPPAPEDEQEILDSAPADSPVFTAPTAPSPGETMAPAPELPANAPTNQGFFFSLTPLSGLC